MDYKFPKIRLGLCCMNITLKLESNIYSSRKNILKQIFKKGIDNAKDLATLNVIDLAKMVMWAKNHGIDVLRISSELVPHATNPEIIKFFGKEGEEYSKFDFLKPFLKQVGDISIKENMRLTFHPGQFVQIGSPTIQVFENSVKELNMHLKFINMMELPKDTVMVIHLGGVFGDKITTIKRFKERFRSLSKDLRDRIVLENDEKCYDVEEVLEVCEELNVPMVFDIFHYYCYKKYHPEKIQVKIDDFMPKVLKTWERRGIRPKFHLSEQAENSPVGSHSVFIKTIPKEFLDIPSKYKKDIDIMIEAKGKEFAISRLYEKYPTLKPEFRLDLPVNIPKKALKTLKLSEEEKCCECDKI